MRLFSKILLATLALSISGPLFALDDKRDGFFFGFGAGFSTSEFDNSSFERSDRQGLGTSFKAGVGIDNRSVAYYVRHVAWSMALQDSLGFSGVGVAHYFSSSPKSVYLSAALGFGDSLDIDRIDDIGAGYMLGGGYQMSERTSWEVNYFNFSDDHVSGSDVSALQFLFQLHWF